jgi:hypothetical protein
MTTEDAERPRIDRMLEGGDLKPRAVDRTITAVTELIPDRDPLKRGYYTAPPYLIPGSANGEPITARTHIVYSDENPAVGGLDDFASPMGYAALAVGF